MGQTRQNSLFGKQLGHVDVHMRCVHFKDVGMDSASKSKALSSTHNAVSMVVAIGTWHSLPTSPLLVVRLLVMHFLFPFPLHSANFKRMVSPLMCSQMIGVFKIVQYWMKLNASNFVPLCRDPRERRCCVAIPPIFGLPGS